MLKKLRKLLYHRVCDGGWGLGLIVVCVYVMSDNMAYHQQHQQNINSMKERVYNEFQLRVDAAVRGSNDYSFRDCFHDSLM